MGNSNNSAYKSAGNGYRFDTPFSDNPIHSFSSSNPDQNGARDFYHSRDDISKEILNAYASFRSQERSSLLNAFGEAKLKSMSFLSMEYVNRIANTLWSCIDLIYPIDRIEFSCYNTNKISSTTGNYVRTSYYNPYTKKYGSVVRVVPFMVIHFENNVDLVYPTPRHNRIGEIVSNTYGDGKEARLGKNAGVSRDIVAIARLNTGAYTKIDLSNETEDDPNSELYSDENNVAKSRGDASKVPEVAEIVGYVYGNSPNQTFAVFPTDNDFVHGFRDAMLHIRKLDNDIPKEFFANEKSATNQMNAHFIFSNILDCIQAKAENYCGVYLSQHEGESPLELSREEINDLKQDYKNDTELRELIKKWRLLNVPYQGDPINTTINKLWAYYQYLVYNWGKGEDFDNFDYQSVEDMYVPEPTLEDPDDNEDNDENAIYDMSTKLAKDAELDNKFYPIGVGKSYTKAMDSYDEYKKDGEKKYAESAIRAPKKLTLNEDDDETSEKTPTTSSMQDMLDLYAEYVNGNMNEGFLTDLFVSKAPEDKPWCIEDKNYPGHYLTPDFRVSDKGIAYFATEEEAIDFVSQDGTDWEKYFEVVKV